MLSKNQRGYEKNGIPRHKRFRHNLADASLAGQMTAARVASLFTDAGAQMLRQEGLLVWIWPIWGPRMPTVASNGSS